MIPLMVLGYFLIVGYVAQIIIHCMGIGLNEIKTKKDFILGFFPWWGIILLVRKYKSLEK
jgi:hypothetical protein